jgi:penicillin-binding protein 1C
MKAVFIFISFLVEAYCSASSLKIIDRNDTEIKTYFDGNEAYNILVSVEDVSPWMLLATIAAEDKRFLEHSGVDIRSTARALWQNTKSGKTVSGASTITQQLVKNLEPREKGIKGKIEEAIKSLLIEKKLSKKEILEKYLNTVSYGNLSKGVGTASVRYFGINAKDLSLAQSSLLAAIPKSPVKYNPLSNKTDAFSRQKYILKRMLELEFIDEELYNIALKEKIIFRKTFYDTSAIHFANMVRRDKSLYPSTTVKTTLDLKLNAELRGILNSQLEVLKSNNVTNGSIVVIDNISGDIIGWVGSKDFFSPDAGQIDGVISLRQPGSALKPFLYALAFSKGYKVSDRIDDSPYFSAGRFRPKNYDESYHGSVTLRDALACSYNIPAVSLAEKIGPDKFLSLLKQLGFNSLNRDVNFYGAGLSLGDGEVSLLELTNAYATLARGGIWMNTNYIYGKKNIEQKRVISRESAYIVTDILLDNSARAQSFGLNSPLNLPFDFAAKTGTSKDYRDNLAIGYTPEWTVGVWVGNFDSSPMKNVSGISGAAPVLHSIAVLMNKRYSSTSFNKPIGVVQIEICPESGMIRGINCPRGVDEIFDRRNVPNKICPIHKNLAPDSLVVHNDSTVLKPIIEFPSNGDVFKIDPQVPLLSQKILLKSNLKEYNKDVVWFVDDRKIVSDANLWLQLTEGKHKIKFLIESENKKLYSNTVNFLVIK